MKNNFPIILNAYAFLRYIYIKKVFIMNGILNLNVSDLLLFAEPEPYSLASERKNTFHS